MITPVSQEFVETGVGGPIRLFGNDSSRVVTIFTTVSAASQVWLCIRESGLKVDGILDLSAVNTFELRQHDYGELANAELWISDGLGNAPTCDLIVIELLLT